MEEYYHVISLKLWMLTTSPIIFPKAVAEKRAEEWQDFTHWPHTIAAAEGNYPEELRWIPDMQKWPVNQTKDLIDSTSHMFIQ